MEHHILPRHHIHSTIRVPYVCSGPRDDGSHEPYIIGPFLEYPARVGKDWMVSMDDLESRSELNLKQRLSFETVHEQEQFVQAWLFFGLLSAFMRTVYKADDYIVVEDNDTYLTTDKLIAKMYESWSVRSATASPEEKMQQLSNAKTCIDVSHAVLQGCYPTFDWRVVSPWPRSPSCSRAPSTRPFCK
jgi:hypothetical protein